jgi:putative endonuclease
MNEFVVYVLRSLPNSEKIYIGYTSDLINRMRSHNTFGTKGYTLRYRPWEVVHVEFFETKTAALAHEKFLKSGVGRNLIREKLMV